MAGNAPDELLFNVKPPFRMQGADAYRKLWEACLLYFPAKFKSEHRDLEVTVSGDVAFTHCLHHIQPIGEYHHRAGETWIRECKKPSGLGSNSASGGVCDTRDAEHVSLKTR